MAAPTSADASPTAQAPQHTEEVDELTAPFEAEEPPAAAAGKPAHGSLLRVGLVVVLLHAICGADIGVKIESPVDLVITSSVSTSN